MLKSNGGGSGDLRAPNSVRIRVVDLTSHMDGTFLCSGFLQLYESALTMTLDQEAIVDLATCTVAGSLRLHREHLVPEFLQSAIAGCTWPTAPSDTVHLFLSGQHRYPQQGRQ